MRAKSRANACSIVCSSVRAKLSETPPFSYSRPTLVATKTVYDLVPCGNEFEQAFAKFLEDALDVERFAKLPEQFGFAIEYTDTNNNLRY